LPITPYETLNFCTHCNTLLNMKILDKKKSPSAAIIAFAKKVFEKQRILFEDSLNYLVNYLKTHFTRSEYELV
jgi:hypothetical protein